jgi:cyclopropane fatty-acyl-phospholipid synthase-like methyltransferase
MQKPFSQACENNKLPILEVLGCHLASGDRVLEVGSGTGQHAVFFGERLPGVTWQTSDLANNHPAIHAWLDDGKLPNVLPPLALDVTVFPWPVAEASAVFSANTAHIMAWPVVQDFVRGVGEVLDPGGLFLLYGPFNYNGTYTSESNESFDGWLAARDPRSAIRDFEAVDEAARRAGLSLVEDNPMPANNRLLVWRRAP